jgi:hypothetical protein
MEIQTLIDDCDKKISLIKSSEKLSVDNVMLELQRVYIPWNPEESVNCLYKHREKATELVEKVKDLNKESLERLERIRETNIKAFTNTSIEPDRELVHVYGIGARFRVEKDENIDDICGVYPFYEAGNGMVLDGKIFETYYDDKILLHQRVDQNGITTIKYNDGVKTTKQIDVLSVEEAISRGF